MNRVLAKKVGFTLLCSIIIFSLGISLAHSQPQKDWDKSYGGGQSDGAACFIQTSDGGYALVGYTRSFDSLQSDFWLVKVDSEGNEEWNKTYGGARNDWGESIIQTSEGGYALAGVFNEEVRRAGEKDFWLFKVDSQGNKEWVKTYGGNKGDMVSSMIQTRDDGYALAGYTLSFGKGEFDFWLVKVDSEGNKEWDETYGGSKTEEVKSFIQTSDNGYALIGDTLSWERVLEDAWLVKVDSEGNKEWSKTYGGSKWDEANSIVKTPDGGYAFAGRTESYGSSNGDAWLVKVDSEGNKEWSKTYGGSKLDTGLCLIIPYDESLAFCGTTLSENSNYSKAWLVKTIIGYNLSVSVVSGKGSINLNPPGGTYDDGEKVTITAEPDEGYKFNNWSGDVSSDNVLITVKMDSHKNISAHFKEEDTLPLLLIIIGIGLITVIIIATTYIMKTGRN